MPAGASSSGDVAHISQRFLVSARLVKGAARVWVCLRLGAALSGSAQRGIHSLCGGTHAGAGRAYTLARVLLRWVSGRSRRVISGHARLEQGLLRAGMQALRNGCQVSVADIALCPPQCSWCSAQLLKGAARGAVVGWVPPPTRPKGA